MYTQNDEIANHSGWNKLSLQLTQWEYEENPQKRTEFSTRIYMQYDIIKVTEDIELPL